MIDETGRPASGDVREQLLAIAAKIAPSDIIAFQAIDPGTGRTEQIATPDSWVTVEFERAFSRHLPEHPLLRHFLRTGDGDSIRMSDVVSRRELRRLGIYQDFYRPLGIHHQMACLLTSDLGVVNTLVFSRGWPDFPPTERRLLLLAGPTWPTCWPPRRARYSVRRRVGRAGRDRRHGVRRDPVARWAKSGPPTSRRGYCWSILPQARKRGRHTARGTDLVAGPAAPRPGLDRLEPPRPYSISRGSRHLRCACSTTTRHGVAAVGNPSAAAPPDAVTNGLASRERDVFRWSPTAVPARRPRRCCGSALAPWRNTSERVYAKLGAASRTEAALRVFGARPGWIRGPPASRPT